MYAPLLSCPLLSSNLDSPAIKILVRHLLKLKKSALQCFDDTRIKFGWKKWATEKRCIHIGITCYKIRTLRESFFGLRIYAFPLQPEVGKPWPLFYRLSNLWSQELFREFELLWSYLCKIWLLKFSKFLGKVIY